MGDHVLIRCHCGQLTDTVQLQHSIPVESILCHCDSCRHCTGALTFSALRLFSPPDSAFTTKLVKYASSNKLWRYFCETCGSHVCYYVVEENSWGVCAGVIEGAIDDRRGRLQIFIGHEFVRDTKDGGLLPIFPTSTVYPGDYNGESVQDWKTALADLKVNVEVNDSTDSLPGECHCGSVRFTVGRPDIRQVLGVKSFVEADQITAARVLGGERACVLAVHVACRAGRLLYHGPSTFLSQRYNGQMVVSSTAISTPLCKGS